MPFRPWSGRRPWSGYGWRRTHPARPAVWLEEALRERGGQRHVMPVYHVPAFPSHRAYEGRISRLVREHWLPLFDARDNITVAFENHDHTYKRTPPIRGLEVSPLGEDHE